MGLRADGWRAHGPIASAAETMITVAGGCGFIGSYVVARLERMGVPVTVVDVQLPPPEWRSGRIRFVQADLRDPVAATTALRGTEVLVLLAARSAGVAFFNEHPADMMLDNLQIVAACTRVAVAVGMRRIVYASSSCVFDTVDDLPIREESLRRAPPPAAGYPFSKLAGEYMCVAAFRQHGLAYTILRPFNVYGVGELPGSIPGVAHVIPDLAKKIAECTSGEIEVFGDGYQTRSFTHARDVAAAITSAATSPLLANDDFNIGSTEEVSIRHLLEMMWQLSGRSGGPRIRVSSGFPIDARRRAVDPAKARHLLGWRPTVPLKEGLREYLRWYSNR